MSPRSFSASPSQAAGAPSCSNVGMMKRDRPHDDRERPLLTVDVDAEAADAGGLVRAVVLADGRQAVEDRAVSDEMPREVVGVRRLQRLCAKVDDVAADSRAGRLAHLEVDVTRLGRHGLAQELLQVRFVRVRAHRRETHRDAHGGHSTASSGAPSAGVEVRGDVGRGDPAAVGEQAERPDRERPARGGARRCRARARRGRRTPRGSPSHPPGRSRGAAGTPGSRRSRARRPPLPPSRLRRPPPGAGAP